MKVKDIRKYITAGRAIFTLYSEKLGVHHTYRVYKKTEEIFYVYLLRGPDNTEDYTYIGHFLYPLRQAPLRYSIVNPMFEAFLTILETREEFEPIYLSTRCARCGRLLTTPESILNGLGPECAKM